MSRRSSQVIGTRLSSTEAELLRVVVGASGTTISAFVRGTLLAAVKDRVAEVLTPSPVDGEER